MQTYLQKILGLCLLLLGWHAALAEPLSVSGVVRDEAGAPLVGVSVVLKGTTKGVMTDPNGAYAMAAEDNGTLVFSFMGMKSEEEPIGNRARIDVTLRELAKELDDVVVIGYGTVRKRDLTGAVASVKTSDIVGVPTSNPLNAIQGKVAGMDIVSSSGNAGAGVDIRIRGNRSIVGASEGSDRNKPLFVIDGVGGGSYDDLNPADIESIEVLKDASSTAIYGSQGANGVVLITTKKGIAGQTRVAYDGYYGVNGLADYPEPRMGEAYMQLYRDGYRIKQLRNTGTWPSNSQASDDLVFTNQTEYAAMQSGQWVNWVDEMQRNATQQSHSVSVRSGTEKTKAFMSLNYYEQEGTVKLNDAQRVTARLNLDQTVNKWFKAGLYSQYTYWNINNRSESALKNGLTARPYGTPYDENGKVNIYPVPGLTDFLNPMLDEYNSELYANNVMRHRVSTSAYAELNPIKQLKLVSNLGANISYQRTGVYTDSISTDVALANKNRVQYNSSIGNSLKWENVLTFKETFAEIHSLTIIGVNSNSWSVSEQSNLSGRNELIPSNLFYKVGDLDQSSLVVSTPYTASTGISWAGRVEYALMDKYLFMASVRWDASSRLPQHWDYFPAVSAAWRISDEKFMQGVDPLNDLKLRVSYGVTGNSGIDEYGTQSLAELVVDKFAYGDEAAKTYGFSSTIGNKELGWEKTAALNVGLDVSLLRSRVNLTLDAYNSDTYDLLMSRTIATIAGGSGTTPFTTYQNIAKVNNKGIEVTLNTVNIDTRGFKWTSTLTFSKNSEQITELYDGQDKIINSTNKLVVGYPIKSFYDYQKIGIWQTSEAELAAKYGALPGDIRVADLVALDENGDGTISDAERYHITVDDQSVIGSQVPSWIGGFSTTFSYMGFDLSASFIMRWGQMIEAEFLGRYDIEAVGGNTNGPAYFSYWTPDNPTNDYPAPGRTKSSEPYFGTLSFVDGSYFKFRTLTLGYTLPTKLAKAIRLERLRVYATGNNLFTVAKSDLIQHYDPERGGSEKSPLSRQFIVGLNFEF
ncbi:MAG: TonB-dependent receptor [Prevotellaceae bacterium]|jgi:TonB-linked SusC/RagA family outer membrane protein|nr:TonB-dependent receptor [Prevotellaceae bacterium]